MNTITIVTDTATNIAYLIILAALIITSMIIIWEIGRVFNAFRDKIFNALFPDDDQENQQ